LKLPKEIIEKPPSAELWAGQTDAAELGADYEMLDKILILVEKGLTAEQITEKGFSHSLVEAVIARVEGSKHKRALPEIIK
jgi:NAD+ synthase